MYVYFMHFRFIFDLYLRLELCGCKVNGVIVYVISEGFKAKSATLEQDLRSVYDEFMSALCTSLNGTALLNEECDHCEEVVNKDSFFISDELEDMCSMLDSVCLFCAMSGSIYCDNCLISGHRLHLIAEVVRENLVC